MSLLTGRNGASHLTRRMGRRSRDAGQAVMALVMGMVTLLALGAGVLATNVIDHDPLIEGDVIQHLAYRALEAGVNAYLSAANQTPNLVDCSTTNNASSSDPNPQCPASNPLYEDYDQWTYVPTPASGVPEYYIWGNPQVVNLQTNTPSTTVQAFSSGQNMYVEVPILGAAGYSSHWVYSAAVADFAPSSGFLLGIWWSNYQATDPALNDDPTSDCTYDWNNAYNGPDVNVPGDDPSNGACGAVFFATDDTLIGPTFSNDSIYVSPSPAFGESSTNTSPVNTADPSCLMVGAINYPTATSSPAEWKPPGCDVQTISTHPCANNSDSGSAPAVASQVNFYDALDSNCNDGFEPLPTTDASLASYAAAGGCLYTGPTTISFYEYENTGRMLVWSPDTPSTQPSGLSCGGGTVKPTPNVPVPTGSHGNGVIYVQNVTNTSCPGTIGTVVGTTDSCETNTDCPAGVNPYDDLSPAIASGTDGAVPATGSNYGSQAQIAYNEYNYTEDLYGAFESPDYADCEGDVFLRNTNLEETTQPALPTGSQATPGLVGSLTVAAANNVVVTGNLTYADCSAYDSSGGSVPFDSTFSGYCPYQSANSNVNDGLGLIADGYIEVNQPLNTCYEWNTGDTACQVTAAQQCAQHGGCPTDTQLNLAVSCASGTEPFVATGTDETDQLAALCDPSIPAGTYSGQGQGPANGVTIDAAVVAVKHSFGVNNYEDDNLSPIKTGDSGGPDLYVYGAIAEDYRGAVGTFCSASDPAQNCADGQDGIQSGFTKYYTWDPRLEAIGLPYFLQPGTASWDISATAPASPTYSSGCAVPELTTGTNEPSADVITCPPPP